MKKLQKQVIKISIRMLEQKHLDILLSTDNLVLMY
jgi:hypothetical protein